MKRSPLYPVYLVIFAVGALAFVLAPMTAIGQSSTSDRQQSGTANQQKSDMAKQKSGKIGEYSRDQINQLINDWPKESKQAAQQMMQKYDLPDGVTPNVLVWSDKEDFMAISVFREAFDHNFPMEHKDVVMHTIAHEVPVDKYDDLVQFSGSIIAARTMGTLSAFCDSEAMNILALNLAHDIINNQKTVDQARQEYARVASTVKQGQGQQDKLTQELQFDVQDLADAQDKDEQMSTTRTTR